jgi:hypothetical protein
MRPKEPRDPTVPKGTTNAGDEARMNRNCGPLAFLRPFELRQLGADEVEKTLAALHLLVAEFHI